MIIVGFLIKDLKNNKIIFFLICFVWNIINKEMIDEIFVLE